MGRCAYQPASASQALGCVGWRWLPGCGWDSPPPAASSLADEPANPPAAPSGRQPPSLPIRSHVRCLPHPRNRRPQRRHPTDLRLVAWPHSTAGCCAHDEPAHTVRRHYLWSNERRHDLFFPLLHGLGGAYMGVGGDQNHTGCRGRGGCAGSSISTKPWSICIGSTPRSCPSP